MLADPGCSVSNRTGSLRCEIRVREHEKVLGIYGQAIVDELTDSRGREVDVSRLQPHPDYARYDPTDYRTKLERPSKLVIWEGQMRVRMNMPLRKRHWPKPVLDATSYLGIQLDVGMPEWVQEKISRIKAHFYVLMAESFEYVDVPFKPSSNWTRLTPEVEVRVAKAVTSGQQYSFDIEVRPQQDALKKCRTIEDDPPERLVVSRLLLKDEKNQGTGTRPNSLGRPTRGRRGRVGRRKGLPCSVGGNGFGGSPVNAPVTRIRYVIAVNPTQYKVPFELENIPLPTGPRPTFESMRDFKLSSVMAEQLQKYEQPRLSREEKREMWKRENEIAGKYLQEMYALEVNRRQWEIIKRKLENVDRLRARAACGTSFEMYRLPGATGPPFPNPRYMHEWGWKWPERWTSRAPAELSEGERIVKELIELIDRNNPNAEQLQQKIDALRDYRHRMRIELAQAIDDLREGLTIRQQAALALIGWFNEGTE